MDAPGEDTDPRADEREIRYLSDHSGVPLAQVRALFRHELARLGIGAKVGSYLAVLTTSNVRGMLRRKTRRAEATHAVQECNVAREQPYLRRWEDDGGRACSTP